MVQGRGQQTFSLKGQIGNNLGLAGQGTKSKILYNKRESTFPHFLIKFKIEK